MISRIGRQTLWNRVVPQNPFPLNIFTKAQAMKPCLNIGIQELLKVIAQILIPLMIGTFTVVIALQQHNLAKENRQKDIEIAQQLREQQWHLDEKRRKQEFDLDEARREQDLSIADNHHQDSIFNVYIRDLSDLLLMNKFNLSRSLLDSIIRPMTLTILRQLDPTRKLLLLKFLYESKMLRSDYEENRLDLSDADLRDIRFGRNRMHFLSLVGASLINTSFIQTDLTSADFQRADLTNSSFINSTLIEVSFYRTRLNSVRFFQSKFHWTDFSHSDLSNSSLTTQIYPSVISFSEALLPNETEGSSENLFLSADRCSMKFWRIEPKGSVNVTDDCVFIALTNHVTMQYQFDVEPFRRLIQRGEALFQLNFRGISASRFRSFQVLFEYFDRHDSVEPIQQDFGIIIAQVQISSHSFSRYQISPNHQYPRNTIRLRIHFSLNITDRCTDWQFFIEHFDYMKLNPTFHSSRFQRSN